MCSGATDAIAPSLRDHCPLKFFDLLLRKSVSLPHGHNKRLNASSDSLEQSATVLKLFDHSASTFGCQEPRYPLTEVFVGEPVTL